MPSLAEDVNVDELRRRARRRLVGAIVLALAAAVIVPMLLESEPKPLGEDVAVKIPPVDEGKFVNRLNDPAAKADKAPPARAPDAKEARPAPEAAKDGKDARPTEPAKAAEARSKYDTRLPDNDAVPAEPRTSPAAAAGTPTPPAPSAAAGAASPTPGAPPPTGAAATSPPPPAVAPAKPTPAASAQPRQGTAPATSAAPPPAAAPAAVPAANGGFAVQLAAFSDDKGANALAGRLKRAGYTAYTEPYKTSKGTLWRVRVGPYASRESANAARDKLKAEGQNGIVAPAH